MAKQRFLSDSDQGKITWLGNFSGKLAGTAGYATKYNITPEEIADLVAGHLYISFWADYLNQYKEYLKKVTAYKNELRDGVPAGGSASVEPTPPVLGIVPPAVAPGIFKRAIAIANRIKVHIGYTVADGQDLGLEGAEIVLDTDIKPIIKGRLVAGGFPELVWKKPYGTDGIHFFVNRGAKTTVPEPIPPVDVREVPSGFIFLASDTEPNYIDTAALPPAGESAVVKYIGILFRNGEYFGQWSDELKITVTGVV